jgi:hypothetical protein
MECFEEEGIVVNGEGRENAGTISRVRRWVKEDEAKEPSCIVVVEMWRTFER